MKFYLAVAALVAIASTLSSAMSITWTGYAGNNQFNTANNWYPNSVPGPNDDVTIHNGTVQCPQAVSINSLLMGDTLDAKAKVTAYNTFNVFQQLNCLQNGEFILPAGSSALSGTISISGKLVFSSGSVSGSVTVSGDADLSGAAAKTISSGQLLLSGSSKIGGVISLAGTQPNLVITGISKWTGVEFLVAPQTTGALFDTTKGSVELISDTSLQANGRFGTLSLDAGANLTLLSNVSFSNALHIHNTSWVTTVGTAVTSISIRGNGNFVSSSASTTFGAQSFDGMIACVGVSCVFGGATSTVGNLVVGTGSVTVTQGTAFSASLISIQNGLFAVSGSVSVGQLNFLKAGQLQGTTVKAKHLYVMTAETFTLNGGVAVSDSANIALATINFGGMGMLSLGPNSVSQIGGAFTLNGAGNAAGFSNNGKITVSGPVASTNINIVGTGDWKLQSSLAVESAELSANTIHLSAGQSVQGSNSCVSIKTIAAGTIKAKIDAISFQCSGACTNINAGCSPMPTDSFSFSA